MWIILGNQLGIELSDVKTIGGNLRELLANCIGNPNFAGASMGT
jgi:hypothetical protein